jgi:DNA-binding transcriptional LysR family regulator
VAHAVVTVAPAWDARSIAIEVRHLRSFVAVAEEGKIALAATRLYMTQPALSRQMQQLEREIGAPLFVRVPHGVELTPLGLELLDKAQVAIEAVDDAVAVATPSEPHGRLVLGLPLAGGRDRWITLTQAFIERFPAVEVEVRQALSEQLQRDVLNRQLDGAFALCPRRVAGLTYTHVLDDVLSVWAHNDHPLATRSELTLADLEGQAITLLGGPAGRDSGFNRAIRRIFEDAGVPAPIEETLQVFPPDAGLTASYLSVTVPVDFPDGVVQIPLVPTRTLPFEFVQRAETNRSALRAYARFAVAHLAEQVYAHGISPA